MIVPQHSSGVPTPRLRIISLGAGVQSTTMALMAAHGEITPMPDCAIFADTQWEPKAVYEHLNWLEGQLPFPVHRVTAGSLRQNVLDRRNTTGGRYAAIPWFIRHPDGSLGMGRRQCTSEYKLTPIMRKLRELLGVSRKARIPKGSIEVWIGISTDEAARMKPARQQYQRNIWPLIDAGMSRADCTHWLVSRYGRTAPKSACLGCPFHDNSMWRAMRDESPEEWADTVWVDRQLRLGAARGMRGEEFMHSQRVPLEDVDLSLPPPVPVRQYSLFVNECDGICGT